LLKVPFEKLVIEAFEENIGSYYDFLDQKRIAQDGLALTMRELHGRHVESLPRMNVTDQLRQNVQKSRDTIRPNPTQNLPRFTPPQRNNLRPRGK